MDHIEPTTRPFGVLADGREVEAITLAAGSVRVTILTYGGIIASVEVPDAAGAVADVVMGFDSLDGWLHDPQFFGAVVGRYANRIREGRFPLDGRRVQLTRNHGAHQLHGGAAGFDKQVWHAQPFEADGAVGVALRHLSEAGDAGYPGELAVTATYLLDSTGALRLDLHAETDRPTVVNLTNHAYFNLAEHGTILDHRVTLHSDEFLEIAEATLPTGRILPVAGTPMDFTEPHRIGARIAANDEQLGLGGGYDHCWVVRGEPGRLRPCAEATGGGRRLVVETTQPGVQFYSGNGIRDRVGRGGRAYRAHSGFCLETQHYPDSPNHPHFPSTRLDPGETLSETTVFRFGATQTDPASSGDPGWTGASAGT